jgi:hypothetical protein
MIIGMFILIASYVGFTMYKGIDDAYALYKSELSNARSGDVMISNYVEKRPDDNVDIYLYVRSKYGTKSFDSLYGIKKGQAIQLKYIDKSVLNFDETMDIVKSDIRELTKGNLKIGSLIVSGIKDVESLYTQIDSTGMFGITVHDRFLVNVFSIIFLVVTLVMLMLPPIKHEITTNKEFDSLRIKYIINPAIMLLASLLSLILFSSSSSDGQFNLYHNKYLQETMYSEDLKQECKKKIEYHIEESADNKFNLKGCDSVSVGGNCSNLVPAPVVFVYSDDGLLGLSDSAFRCKVSKDSQGIFSINEELIFLDLVGNTK